MILGIILLAIILIMSAFARALFYTPMGTYLIKKGSHYSIFKNSILKPRIFHICDNENVHWLKFTAKIKNCVYAINHQDQINKLLGYSFHLFKHHHKNSIRIGWRYIPHKRKVDILAYWYENGERKYLSLAQIDVKTTADEVVFNIEMCTTQTQHIIIVNDDICQIPISTPPFKYGWILAPYFGGETAAPHDIECRLWK